MALLPGYDVGGLDVFKGSHTSKADRPTEHISHAPKTDDADTTLAKIKSVIDEIEDVAKARPELRTHFLANLHEAKGKMIALQVKSDCGLMHLLSQPSIEIGPGSKNLRRLKSCLETGWKKGNIRTGKRRS